MLTKILFVITGADHINGASEILHRERYIEYMLSLSRIFSYNIPVAGVLSEYDATNTKIGPAFDKFPFIINKKIELGILDGLNKSQKEFKSIASLINDLEEKQIDDDTIIIKVSGRYLITNDSFMRTVTENIDNKNVQSIMKLVCNNTQQATFLFALRYKYFKQFYRQNINVLNNKNIEKAHVDFLIANDLFKYAMRVDTLGILAHINNENIFTEY